MPYSCLILQHVDGFLFAGLFNANAKDVRVVRARANLADLKSLQDEKEYNPKPEEKKSLVKPADASAPADENKAEDEKKDENENYKDEYDEEENSLDLERDPVVIIAESYLNSVALLSLSGVSSLIHNQWSSDQESNEWRLKVIVNRMSSGTSPVDCILHIRNPSLKQVKEVKKPAKKEKNMPSP
ncbi:Oidioi.mRNA.OKI2018_I69.PAR.g8446.t1.cds [Oikopleura dioica]|uniref:Oidioi.mRNA.OKI2018_I69.PAR.g8446.t1.cds n=1 Tax=Oikopleura dioica TaxID=34765 RepID=A0ABN7RKF0_OIKDI|nr:Oidioi.mRNA.OKI2018_I69.PAR.g8446.t1.cds [Oikopleura dioica]